MKKAQLLKHMLLNRQITPKRTLNLLRNYYAMKRKDPNVSGYPSIMMIEPTNFCNLRCPLCPTGNGGLSVPRGYMHFDGFKQIIDECGDYLLSLTLWNWGEPFLNRDIYKMIEYAKSKNIHMRVSTNGHFIKDDTSVERLIKSGLDEIMFALDGATPETYAKYRVGGDFYCVVNNLQKLVNMKKKMKSKTPFIELQFIVMSHNEHEVPKIREMAEKIGVDRLRLKTVSIEGANTLGYEEEEKKQAVSFKPNAEKYSRYTENMIRKEIQNSCTRLWLSTVVNWDGTVSPCCNDPNRDYDFGNIFKKGFLNVWTSPRYVGFRRAVLKNKPNIPMCRNCSGALMDLEVEYAE